MRPPRPGSAWTSSRWARRGWYADYMNSPAWVARKRRWFREHWARTHQLAACIVCGGRPVELHHMDYGLLGNEKHEDITALCRSHHARIHAAWDATPHLRRLGRRAATVVLVQAMRREPGR